MWTWSLVDRHSLKKRMTDQSISKLLLDAAAEMGAGGAQQLLRTSQRSKS
eukprot:gene16132-19135_t